MTQREYTAYEWTCDRCGDTEVDEVEGIPLDWETLDEGDYCDRCAVIMKTIEAPSEPEPTGLTHLRVFGLMPRSDGRAPLVCPARAPEAEATNDYDLVTCTDCLTVIGTFERRDETRYLANERIERSRGQ